MIDPATTEQPVTLSLFELCMALQSFAAAIQCFEIEQKIMEGFCTQQLNTKCNIVQRSRKRRALAKVLGIQPLHDGKRLQLRTFRVGVEGAAGPGCHQALLPIFVQGSVQQGCRMHLCTRQEGATPDAKGPDTTQRTRANEGHRAKTCRGSQGCRLQVESDAVIADGAGLAGFEFCTYDSDDTLPSSTWFASTPIHNLRFKGTFARSCRRL